MDLDLSQLRALSAVIAEGSLEAAAGVLHVTPSAVSQRLRALEAATGQVLLVRSRPARLTPPGRVVLRLAHQIELLTTDAAVELTSSATGQGTPVVAIAVNADSLSTWVLPALAEVAADVCLDLRREDQARTAGLLREGVVVAAVTAEADPVPGCTATRLGRMRYRPAASPAFAARFFSTGVDATALTTAPVVVFDRDDDLQDEYLRARSPGAHPPRHHVPASTDFLAAVQLGMGWGMVPDMQVAAALSNGDLVDLDPTGAIDVTLYWQQWKLRSSTLQQVATTLRTAAADHLH